MEERLPRHPHSGLDHQQGHLVDAFRAAKIIGPKTRLAFFARPSRDDDGWAVVVDLPAARKAATAAREALASALGVDEAQLVLDRTPTA